MYLTFDDGPSDIVGNFSKNLTSMGVKATFFWVQGHLDEKLETSEGQNNLHDVLAGGHAIGGHTMHHANLAEIDEASMDDELLHAKEHLEAATGRASLVFRPPYARLYREG